MKNQDRKRK